MKQAMSDTERQAPAVYDRREALTRIADDEPLLNDLLDMFLADAQGYLDDLRQAQAEGDAERLQRAAHTLKGILATFSAMPAHGRALELEQAARKGPAEAVQGCLERLETEMDRLLRVLRRERAA